MLNCVKVTDVKQKYQENLIMVLDYFFQGIRSLSIYLIKLMFQTHFTAYPQTII